MDAEDLEPRKQPTKPADFDRLSVEALQDYIAELRAEIARAEAAIQSKQSWRNEAEAFFKKS